ncbi:MAG TPA: hypothetical protein PLZ51_12915, partial [Aggregatilineales bacterium]|nr:hypothetical protein [Aggregatilineales bacterium]
ADQIDKLNGYKVNRDRPFFNEFVVKCPISVAKINQALIERGIIGGYDLEKEYPQLKDHALFCVTEMNSKDEIDTLVKILGEVK